MTTDTSRYAARGVSSGKEAVAKATEKLDKGFFPGAFCTIVRDIAGDPAYGSILHADGAGTKASLAYLQYCETKNARVWHGIAQDSLVMNIDDAACVGALDTMHVVQQIERNRFRVGDEVISALVDGCKAFCARMNALGFDLEYVGGETADVADLNRTVSVNNAIAMRLPRDKVIDASRMVPGDVIIGFSSTGKAAWEDEENSGVGSNGLTNARHDALDLVYRTVVESYAPELPPELVYRGKYQLSDRFSPRSRFTVGSALLSPTRTYAPLIREILRRADRQSVHGFIHCSGGGQTKIRKFGKSGNVYVKDNLFPVPPLFEMLKEVSGLPWEQMYKVFNMGHRLEAVVSRNAISSCFKAADEAGIEARCVGHVEPSSNAHNTVVIYGPDGKLVYA